MEAPYAILIGAAIAGLVQGLSGFGFSLTALSIWAWFLEPQLAAALAVSGALTGQIFGALIVRRGFEWQRLFPFLLGGIIGVPIGTALLPRFDILSFKALLGGFLVAWGVLMLSLRTLPTVRSGGRLADAAAGCLGGLMGGMGGLMGLIPALWCALRGFPKNQQRCIIQNFNLVILSITLLVYLKQGIVTLALWPLLASVALFMLIPMLLGIKLYKGLSETAFRKTLFGFLTAAGLALLTSSVVRWAMA